MKTRRKKKLLKPLLNIRQQRSQAIIPDRRKSSQAIAIVTGGGDCPGLNAAIRAVVRKAEPAGLRIYGVLEGFRGIYDDLFVPLRSRDVSGIISLGGTILGTSRFNPFAQKDVEKKVKSNLAKRNIRCLINIGGEGTMRCSYELNQLGIPCIGVPKTIDNDVWGSDFTFGFDTAVFVATEALDRLHTTAESHNRVMLLEVMGRHAGWIATYSGIAGGAEAILIPEETFRLSRLIDIIQTRRKIGKYFSIIVVSEDAKILLDMDPRKKPLLLRTPMLKDEYGNVKLGGITFLLEKELRRHLKMEVRSTVLGYIQRGGSPTPYDRVLATRLGVAAAELALKNRSGRMVGLKGTKIYSLPFSKVVKKLKTVDKKIYKVGEVFFG